MHTSLAEDVTTVVNIGEGGPLSLSELPSGPGSFSSSSSLGGGGNTPKVLTPEEIRKRGLEKTKASREDK
jgi:hypothetical protein